MALSRTNASGRPPARRSWHQIVMVLVFAVAGGLAVLGITGTFGSWTSAVLANSTNTIATADAVILQETNGADTCTSSETSANTSSCSSINKYGGVTAPLSPGQSRNIDVTFTNVGQANASSFTMTPGACNQSPIVGSGVLPAADLCASGDFTVTVSCSPGASYTSGSAWTDLAYAAGAPPTVAKVHTALGEELNAGAKWTCRFTAALIAGAAVADQGIAVSQAIQWTLNQ